MTRRQKNIPYKQAIEILRQPDRWLMLMMTSKGRQYFIVPNGPVEREVAEQILVHPLCHVRDNGLFVGIEQSWSLFFGDADERADHLNFQKLAETTKVPGVALAAYYQPTPKKELTC